ncbi:MAG TPA: DUF58 domain-containing protein [Planctomycetota bacterium]|nr:DUF58 domain-containing protein [Planctomycetota bacterium]
MTGLTDSETKPIPQLLTPEFMARLGALSVISKKILAGKLRGERRSKKRGESLEFADHRQYSQGDDLRRIDWNLYGRLEKLFLKLFLAEEDLSVYVLLDGSKSMNYGSVNKFDYARKVAAALSYIGICNLDRVTVTVNSGGKEHVLSNIRGKKQVFRLFDFLSKIEPDGGTDLQELARRFVIRNRRPGVLLMVSDFLDPNGFEAPLKTLIGNRMDVFAVHVLAKEEVDPVLTGDFLLVDSETGEKLDVTASKRLVDNYVKTVRGFCSSLQTFCSTRGISYLFASTDLPFEVLVLNYLRTAGLVR